MRCRDLSFRRWRAVAFASITLGAWGCKAGPGPPPLAPGTDPAFERLLAQLDERYSFLFVDKTRVFVARMQGAEETVLLDLEKDEDANDAVITDDQRLSPDGRWLLVPYSVSPYQADNSYRRLLVLDVGSGEVRRVPLLQDEDFGFDGGSGAQELCHWLAPDRFVISLSHYPKGGGSRKKFYQYELAELSSPHEITGFGDVEPVFYQVPGTGRFLWGRSDEPTNSWTIHVYDASGFRLATSEERAIFEGRYVDRRVPNGPRDAVLDAYHNAEPLFDFEDVRSHWDIRFGRRLVRRTWTPTSTVTWDEDLRLYTWHETDYGSGGTSYVMDTAGRYRRWHRGELILKLPRERPHVPSSSPNRRR